MDITFWLHLAILLAVLLYAAPRGGMALALCSGVGLAVYIFGCGMKPGNPPAQVLFTIMAVVLAASTLQAAGGLDCILQIAERVLRNHPRSICYLAPYITWLLGCFCGTGHTIYAIQPIIYDVAIKNNIRPERPMAVASIANQMGVICSPASVAAVALIGILDGRIIGGSPFGFFQLFAIVIPAAIVGIFLAATFSVFRGKDLDKDEKFQELIKDPEQRKYIYGETTTLLGVKFSKRQWAAFWLFLGGIAVVALLGCCAELRPLVGKKRISMTVVIQIVMLFVGAMIFIFCMPKKVQQTSVFSAGMIAIVSVYGVAWMSDTMFAAHLPQLKLALTDFVKAAPWAYGVVLLLVSKLVNSQAGAVILMAPVALAIGTPPGIIVAMASACYGYYILPTYPCDLGTMAFDRSGTTHIGKYVINHSFIAPGLIGVVTAVVVGYILGMVYGYI